MNIKSKKDEYEQFSKLSEEWWDEDGKFKILHEIRPIRMEYIKNQFKYKNFNNLQILDIGCGGGLVTESLSRLGAKVTGIDFIENNIRVAKKHSKNNNLKIIYKCVDAEKLEFKNKFDVIILFEILEHLEDWPNFISKIKLNLKKNGKILLSTINRNIISKYTAIYLAENILNWIPRNTHDYNKFIKPDELKNVLIKKGFKIENIKGLKYNLFSGKWKLSDDTSINYFLTASNSN